MPSNISFLLDSLLVDEAYEVTGGNTEPSILHGLFGNITFEPWAGFKKFIKDAEDVVESLDDEKLELVRTYLHVAREFINRKREIHLKYEQTEMERRALCESKSAEQTTDDKSSDEKVRKKARLEPWYVRKPVTSSSSISDLHGNVMGALHELLRVMYPDKLLDLEEKLISTENMFGEATEEMIFKYMCDYMKAKKLISEEDEPQILLQRKEFLKEKRGEEGNPAEVKGNEESSKSLPADMEHGTKGTHSGSEENGCTAEGRESAQAKEGELLRRSARLEEKYRGQKLPSLSDQREGCSFSVPTQPVIKLNQTPDRSLFRVNLDDPDVIPVCCYEFKGPTLDLSGLVSSDTDITSSQAVSHENSLRLHEQFQLVAESTDAGVDDTSNIANSEGQELEDDLYLPGKSARDTAANYNSIFSDISKMGKATGTDRLILLPIAQVICQALLSKTGCVFLTNHQTAFALRVEEDQAQGSFGAKVFVTGAIPCNKEPGGFAAMLGFTKYCLDSVLNQTGEDEMLNPMRRLLTSLAYSTYNADYKMEPLDPNWCPGDNSTASGQGSGSASGNSHAKNVSACVEGTQSIKTVSDAVEKSDPGVPHNQDREQGEATATDVLTDMSLSSISSASTANQISEAALQKVGTRHKPFRSNMDERLKAMFSATNGLMAVGGSGILIRGVWDGTEVAIKMWNGQSREGFLSIRQEIKIFKRLQIKCPSVLGSAVPRFLLGWDRPQEHSVYRKELILLTELVGDGISRDTNGNIWIECRGGFEILTQGGRILMCNAALSSLEELHMNGFLHGDISIGNLRAMRKPQSELGWKVWWVDLGRALEVKSRGSAFYFEFERRKCLALFRSPKQEGTEIARGASRYRRSNVKSSGSVAVV